MRGTEWTGTGKGATIFELSDAFLRAGYLGVVSALSNWPSDAPTNLALTGRVISDGDAKKVASASFHVMDIKAALWAMAYAYEALGGARQTLATAQILHQGGRMGDDEYQDRIQHIERRYKAACDAADVVKKLCGVDGD